MLGGDQVDNKKLNVEIAYNFLDLFLVTKLSYIFVFVLLLANVLIKKKIIYVIAIIGIIIALISSLAGVAIRVFVTQRPPVATLYESIIFVALIINIIAIIVEMKNSKYQALFIASITGTILHLIAYNYSLQGDTLGTLVAVLNNNFWLATHVITITTGYGFCIFASLLAHIYLFKLGYNKDPYEVKQIYQALKIASLVSLLVTLIGTMLGGIWADQSWGRFWGWDPKENGALLIVLWLIFLLHSRISNLISDRGFALGMVITNIVVVLAWFGVNLLNVGLHSYGFAEGIALNIFLFTIIQLLVAGYLYHISKPVVIQ